MNTVLRRVHFTR